MLVIKNVLRYRILRVQVILITALHLFVTVRSAYAETVGSLENEGWLTCSPEFPPADS